MTEKTSKPRSIMEMLPQTSPGESGAVQQPKPISSESCEQINSQEAGSSKHQAVIARLWSKMDALYPGTFVLQAGSYNPDGFQFKEWYKHTLPLTRAQWSRAFEECERGIAANGRNGEKIWPPSAIVFVEWAKHGNKPAGVGARCLVGWNSPEHPRFDKDSGEYGGKPHPDSKEAAALLANPNAGKAISKGEIRKRGNDALKTMMEGLDGDLDAADRARYAPTMAEAKIRGRKKEEAERQDRIKKNREEYAKQQEKKGNQ